MGCKIFPKIDTLFERKEDFTVDTTKIRRPEFSIPYTWVVTEKIDGTNCRVSLETEHQYEDGIGVDKWVVRFRGRTENSQIPTFLLDHLQNTFTLEKMQNLWRDDEKYPITLYGEGYGAKIQKGGGNYRKDGDVSFRLFDVLIGGFWLSRENVEDIAEQLDIEAVPLLSKVALLYGDNFSLYHCHHGIKKIGFTKEEIVALVMGDGFKSRVANEEGVPGIKAEGIVAFTEPKLYNNAGKRLTFKLKTKDFIAGKR